MVPFNHVDGKDCGKVTFYGLSTCVWCRRRAISSTSWGWPTSTCMSTSCRRHEQEKAMAEVRRWNPNESFPVLVFNESACVLGFDEQKIRAAVKL